MKISNQTMKTFDHVIFISILRFNKFSFTPQSFP